MTDPTPAAPDHPARLDAEPRRGRRLWSRERHVDHDGERLEAAWERLFGTSYVTARAVAFYARHDLTVWQFAAGAVVREDASCEEIYDGQAIPRGPLLWEATTADPLDGRELLDREWRRRFGEPYPCHDARGFDRDAAGHGYRLVSNGRVVRDKPAPGSTIALFDRAVPPVESIPRFVGGILMAVGKEFEELETAHARGEISLAALAEECTGLGARAVWLTPAAAARLITRVLLCAERAR